MKMIAQGDVLFVRRDKKLQDRGDVKKDGVIALGESTGHMHRIRPGQEAILKYIAGVMYIEVMKACIIEHVKNGMPTGDHNEVILPPGNWEVVRQREHTPNGFRQVLD